MDGEIPSKSQMSMIRVYLRFQESQAIMVNKEKIYFITIN